jgi:hypothetical protein
MGNNDAKIILPTGEIDAFEQEKGKYTLAKQSPISTPQILRIVQKTPKEHIKTRPAKGGGEWDYVTGTYIKKVLNFAFGWLWDFQIVDKGREGDMVWVQGRLTIRDAKTLQPIIIKEQFGGAEIKYMTEYRTDSKTKRRVKVKTNKFLDYGNDLKAAATDALKKCASELGIASDIYGSNEFREMGAKVQTTEATAVEVSSIPASKPSSQPPVQDTGHDCFNCGALITKAEADYSKRIFKKPLCRKCQADAKKK